MFSRLSLVATILAASTAYALILPTPTIRVVAGRPLHIGWYSTPSDPVFDLELVKASSGYRWTLANDVAPGQASIVIPIPYVPAGDGYTLQAVNTTQVTEVYAATGEFPIAAD